MNNVRSKFKKTNRDFVYHYLFSKALPGKPTLLFIHGFPSTSYDWYKQIDYFQPKGYGLIVPDMLGYGKTEPKSIDPAHFLQTAIAQDLLEILDEESVGKNVVAIGHDWGSFTASVLSVKHSDRFLGFAFTTPGYTPLSVTPPIDDWLELQQEMFGRPLMGYFKFFGAPDAVMLIELNIESFLDIIYPADPETWKKYMNRPGEFEEFVRQHRRLSRAPYLTPEHYEHIKSSLLEGINNEFKSTLSEEDIKIKKPAFVLAAKYDHVCLPGVARTATEKHAQGGLITVELDAGHWIQLEKSEEYNEALEEWIANEFRL